MLENSFVYQNDLEKFFWENKSRPINKWLHYFEYYDRHFSKFRNKKVRILEIGVFLGGSLNMWRAYFGPEAFVLGVDIDSSCTQYAGENIKIEIGNQADPSFLEYLKGKYEPFDIIIDDGGHQMEQQITSLKFLFGHLNNGGIYLVEDLHTSYWKEYNGGYRCGRTFIEYAKGLIDELNYVHIRKTVSFSPDRVGHMSGLHFYDSMLFIEKRKLDLPVSKMTGDPELISRANISMPYVYSASRLRLLWWKFCTYMYTLSGNTYLKERYRKQLELRKQYDSTFAFHDTGGDVP